MSDHCLARHSMCAGGDQKGLSWQRDTALAHRCMDQLPRSPPAHMECHARQWSDTVLSDSHCVHGWLASTHRNVLSPHGIILNFSGVCLCHGHHQLSSFVHAAPRRKLHPISVQVFSTLDCCLHLGSDPWSGSILNRPKH